MTELLSYDVGSNDCYVDSDIIRAAPSVGTSNERDADADADADASANTIYEWSVNISANASDVSAEDVTNINNWWALLALTLVLGTAAGNILVCLAITWERRLQNVTNYFLMSLAITDLMVAVLVMPLGILTLVRGKT
jgi:hypothetical protein